MNWKEFSSSVEFRAAVRVAVGLGAIVGTILVLWLFIVLLGPMSLVWLVVSLVALILLYSAWKDAVRDIRWEEEKRNHR